MENLQIIEQAINIAVTKGAYNLQEIDAILKALKELIKDKELTKNEDVS
jgi:DNA replication protein DnaD